MAKIWPTVHYTKGEIKRAGKILRNPEATAEELLAAREVANAWRRAHAYPVNTWQNRVRRYLKDSPDALLAQRMKRLPSIERKLKKQRTMQLDGMQDLGGVRVVVRDVDEVRRIENLLLSRPNGHELKEHQDYLTSPKEDGYRSVHVVYAYTRASQTSWAGYKTEIQIRTQLQHFWATALETVDLFTKQSLKGGGGDPQWREFFALMSSEIAAREGLPLVPGTPVDAKERRARLNELDEAHELLAYLHTFRTGVTNSTGEQAGMKHLLLDLDLGDYTLEVSGFADEETASAAYAALEVETHDNDDRDVVLVAVDDAKRLPQTYPNYFANLQSFISLATYAMALKRPDEDDEPEFDFEIELDA